MSEREDENIMMNIREVARLIDWLKSKGFEAEEIMNCINYIAENPTTEEKGSETPAKR